MAYGNESGLAIVDIEQKVCLFNVASPDLYGAQDPYSRTPRSPKRSEPPYSRDEQRSPSIDQVSGFNVIHLLLHVVSLFPRTMSREEEAQSTTSAP